MSYGQVSYGELSYGEDYSTTSSGISASVTENITVAGVLLVNWTSSPTVQDDYTLTTAYLAAHNRFDILADIFSADDTYDLFQYLVVSEVSSINAGLTSSGILHWNLTDTFDLSDIFGDIERLYAAVLLTSVTGIAYKVYITDGTEVSEFIPGYLYYLGIEEQVLINDLLLPVALGLIAESIESSDVAFTTGDFKVFVVENLENNDRLIIGLPTTITDSLELNDTPSGIREQLVSILNNLVVDGTLLSAGSFIVNQDEVFNILDAIGTDAFEALVSSLTGSDSLSVRLVASMALTGSMELSEALTQSVEGFLKAIEDFALNDLNDTQTDGVVSVSEEINITHLFNPVNMRSWVMNPENYAVYNYTFGFTQTTRFGSSYLMADDTGLYELGGTTDAGESITSVITTAALDFGAESLKQVPAVLLGTNGTDFILQVSIDGGKTARYQINHLPDELGTKRIKLGKGLIGRNWQFTLITDNNSEFDLDSFEFYPIVFKRKHNG
ncbi:MAG: hypothetical protein H6961_07160 [Chromatiaceae bacterium]|nr:hypothetical protein [Chromatiaceae bacterium]